MRVVVAVRRIAAAEQRGHGAGLQRLLDRRRLIRPPPAGWHPPPGRSPHRRRRNAASASPRNGPDRRRRNPSPPACPAPGVNTAIRSGRPIRLRRGTAATRRRVRPQNRPARSPAPSTRTPRRRERISPWTRQDGHQPIRRARLELVSNGAKSVVSAASVSWSVTLMPASLRGLRHRHRIGMRKATRIGDDRDRLHVLRHQPMHQAPRDIDLGGDRLEGIVVAPGAGRRRRNPARRTSRSATAPWPPRSSA